MSNRPTPRQPSASGTGGQHGPLEAIREAGLGPVVERARWLATLDRQLRLNLPPALSDHCRLGNVRGDTLVFFVDSPVWKAKLRLHADALLDAARATGLPARELLLKVTSMPTVPPVAAARLPLSPAARDALRTAAQSIADPDLQAKLLELASVP